MFREQFDYIVVGGGIAGISAAAALSASGTTLLLESEPHLAHHASGRSAALYEPHYGPPPIVALSHASGPELEAAGVLSPRRVLLVAGPDQAALFDRDVEDLNLTPVTVAAACAAFPPLDPEKVGFAAQGQHAKDIDTDALIQHYLRIARTNGARIQTGAQVTAIRPGWTVTAGQDWHGRTLVNAAGAWADRVAGLAGAVPLGLVPHRRSMARIPAPGGLDPSGWPMVFSAGETWYAKPDAGALIVSPADADPAEPHDAWADDMVLAEGLARYEAMTRFAVTRVLSNWAGLRTFAPDKAPVIGRDPRLPDFVWCAGQGGYGFQSAPAAARLLADLVTGRAVDAALAAQVSPARLAPPP